MEQLDADALLPRIQQLIERRRVAHRVSASRALEYVLEQVALAVTLDEDPVRMWSELKESEWDRQAEDIPDGIHSQVAVLVAAAGLKVTVKENGAALSALRRLQDQLAAGGHPDTSGNGNGAEVQMRQRQQPRTSLAPDGRRRWSGRRR